MSQLLAHRARGWPGLPKRRPGPGRTAWSTSYSKPSAPGQDDGESSSFPVRPQVADLGRHLGLARHQDEPLAAGQFHGDEEALVVFLVDQLVPGRRRAQDVAPDLPRAAWPCRAGRSRSSCTRMTTPNRSRRLRSRRPGRPPSPGPGTAACSARSRRGRRRRPAPAGRAGHRRPPRRSNRSARPGRFSSRTTWPA